MNDKKLYLFWWIKVNCCWNITYFWTICKDKNFKDMSTKKSLLVVRKHVKTLEWWQGFNLRSLIGPGIFTNAFFYIVIYIKFENTTSLTTQRHLYLSRWDRLEDYRTPYDGAHFDHAQRSHHGSVFW